MTDNKKIKIFGESDCYGLTEEMSFTLRLMYEMKDKVDGDCLREAVRMLEKRFYYLKLTLKKDWHEFYYVENSLPWVVTESEKCIPLNGKESNYHLLAFTYFGNKISVSAFHAQLDGIGMYRVAKALLYYYCCLKYNKKLDVSDVALPDDEILPEESIDAYRWFFEQPAENDVDVPPSQKQVKNVLKLQQMSLVGKGERISMQISLPQADLMKYCSSFDGSPATAIALMVADAIYNLHPDSGKEIVVGIPVNLRPAMGLKVSHSSTFSKIYIHYSEKLRKKDFETQGTICRGTVIRYSDKALLRKQTKQYCKKLAMLNMIPLRSLKQYAARFVANQMKNSETADVTYVGKCDFGEMNQYITSIQPSVDGYGLGLILSVAAFADRFFIGFDQDWPERDYIDAFFEVLRKRGIAYKIEYEGPHDTAVMDI